MKARTIPQNKLLHVLVDEIVQRQPRAPWKKVIAREAWKRYLLRLYMREARMEAYANGWPDPFPTGQPRSRDLDDRQMAEALECTYAFAAQYLNVVLD